MILRRRAGHLFSLVVICELHGKEETPYLVVTGTTGAHHLVARAQVDELVVDFDWILRNFRADRVARLLEEHPKVEVHLVPTEAESGLDARIDPGWGRENLGELLGNIGIPDQEAEPNRKQIDDLVLISLINFGQLVSDATILLNRFKSNLAIITTLKKAG